MSFYRLITISLTVCLLCACSSVSRKQEDGLLIANHVFFQLLPSGVFDQSSEITQKVTIQYQEKQNTFIARLEVGPQGFVVVALTELGQTVFTLQYKNNRLSIDKALIPTRLPDLKYLLADLQLIYWPLPLLQKQLNADNVELLQTDASGMRRSLRVRGRRVIDIEYSGEVNFTGNVIFTHHERGYTISADVLEVD